MVSYRISVVPPFVAVLRDRCVDADPGVGLARGLLCRR